VNHPILNLDELIGIIASGIAQDDIPATEVRAVEESGPAVMTNSFRGESDGSAGKDCDCDAEKDTASRDDHIRALAETI
jgi:hypothetical protein